MNKRGFSLLLEEMQKLEAEEKSESYLANQKEVKE